MGPKSGHVEYESFTDSNPVTCTLTKVRRCARRLNASATTLSLPFLWRMTNV